MSKEISNQTEKKQWILYGVMQRYFFVSWNKYWKGIYIHLPKVTHRFYFNKRWNFKHDKYSNVGFRLSQKLGS